jgi:phosphatidylserine/phosphatidylglycerophosphate/cardiolipin synthase-like enzyme
MGILVILASSSNFVLANFQKTRYIKDSKVQSDINSINTVVSNTSNMVNTTTNNSSDTSYYFSQDTKDLDKHLIDVINFSIKSLDIAIYSITKPNIIDAIVKAKKRGVNVNLITDREESKTRSEKEQLDVLKSANIPIKINTSTRYIMHMKVTIADSKIVTTGSYNYTSNATYGNDEVLLVINNAKTGKDWTNEFNKMWSDAVRFKSY